MKYVMKKKQDYLFNRILMAVNWSTNEQEKVYNR